VGRVLTLALAIGLAAAVFAPAAGAHADLPEHCGPPLVAGGQPALVAVVIDGISSQQLDSGTADPLAVANWCPVTPTGAERKFPLGLDWGMRTWAGFTTGAGIPQTQACLPEGGLAKDSCVVKRLADAGAVILPYSYTGSLVSRSSGGSTFGFKGYTSRDTFQDPATSTANLEAMLASIQSAWPAARVMVVAHSYGGTITEAWWRKHHADRDQVDQLFALDSPINGVQLCAATAFLFSPIVAQELCRRWYGRDQLNREAIALDADGLFVPIAAPNDPTYSPPIGGLRAELFYRCPDEGEDVGSPCIAAPSMVAKDPACDASGPGLYGRRQHHLVIACPEVVRRIAAAADTRLGVATSCRAAPAVRPSVVMLGCARRRAALRKIRWSSFGAREAHGTARLRGRRVRIDLTRPRPCNAAHRFVYTRLFVERNGRAVAHDRPRCHA
jgi:pimeloyl-ACP methyl ester carboxylesterase